MTKKNNEDQMELNTKCESIIYLYIINNIIDENFIMVI